MSRTKSGFGQSYKLPSGMWRARYSHLGQRYAAPHTFIDKNAADVWLAEERVRISKQRWTPPGTRPVDVATVLTFTEYATALIDGDELAVRTRSEYRRLLAAHLAPEFGAYTLPQITEQHVSLWFTRNLTKTKTQRARAYSLLARVMSRAVRDHLIDASPCNVENGSKTKRKSKTIIATPEEVAVIARAFPIDHALMVLLMGWAGLRYGEVTELRRADVDIAHERLAIDRGVVRVDAPGVKRKVAEYHVGDPKADSGRNLPLPPILVPLVDAHLADYVGPKGDALLFPSVRDKSRHLSPGTFRKWWVKGCVAAGRVHATSAPDDPTPNLRPHDLRHTAGTRFAQQGATLAEIQEFLGHSTIVAAQRYQHAAADRMTLLAGKMSDVAQIEPSRPVAPRQRPKREKVTRP